MSETIDHTTFVLPSSVATKIDLSRLTTEMERIDSELVTRDAHIKSGVPITDEIAFTEQMKDFLAANNLEIGDTLQRAGLIRQLRQLKANAPVAHVTFASPVDTESLRQITAWLRESVHPQAIIVVGLQPSLIGGVYIRTPNHVHDFSLRAQLAGHRDIIVKEVEVLSGNK